MVSSLKIKVNKDGKITRDSGRPKTKPANAKKKPTKAQKEEMKKIQSGGKKTKKQKQAINEMELVAIEKDIKKKIDEKNKTDALMGKLENSKRRQNEIVQERLQNQLNTVDFTEKNAMDDVKEFYRQANLTLTPSDVLKFRKQIADAESLVVQKKTLKEIEELKDLQAEFFFKDAGEAKDFYGDLQKIKESGSKLHEKAKTMIRYNEDNPLSVGYNKTYDEYREQLENLISKIQEWLIKFNNEDQEKLKQFKTAISDKSNRAVAIYVRKSSEKGNYTIGEYMIESLNSLNIELQASLKELQNKFQTLVSERRTVTNFLDSIKDSSNEIAQEVLKLQDVPLPAITETPKKKEEELEFHTPMKPNSPVPLPDTPAITITNDEFNSLNNKQKKDLKKIFPLIENNTASPQEKKRYMRILKDGLDLSQQQVLDRYLHETGSPKRVVGSTIPDDIRISQEDFSLLSTKDQKKIIELENKYKKNGTLTESELDEYADLKTKALMKSLNTNIDPLNDAFIEDEPQFQQFQPQFQQFQPQQTDLLFENPTQPQSSNEAISNILNVPMFGDTQLSNDTLQGLLNFSSRSARRK